MILEVKQFPASQEVIDKEGWFLIGDYGEDVIIGDSAYGKVLDESEYILVEKTTAYKFNKEFISGNDPGDEHKPHKKRGKTRRRDDRRHGTRRKTVGDRRR